MDAHLHPHAWFDGSPAGGSSGVAIGGGKTGHLQPEPEEASWLMGRGRHQGFDGGIVRLSIPARNLLLKPVGDPRLTERWCFGNCLQDGTGYVPDRF